MLPDCDYEYPNTNEKLSTHCWAALIKIERTIFTFLTLLFIVFVPMQASATAHQITPWANNKGGAVSITFDDGATSQYTLAVPALNAQGFQGTFFVTTNWIDSATWDEWRDVSNQGHEMGSHTENHPHLPQLSLTEMIEEIGGSKAAIDAQIVTQQCLTFAYPFGEYDVNAKAVAEDYYLAARGISCDLNSVPYDFYDLRACEDYLSLEQMKALTDQAEQQGKWLITLHHGLDGSGYGYWTIGTFRNYLDYLTTKNVWTSTYGSVVKYIRERSSANLSLVANSQSQIVVNLTDTLDDAVFDEPLTIRSEVPANWATVSIQQGTGETNVTSVVEGTETVIYYNVVPDRGLITLQELTVHQPTVTDLGPSYATVGGPSFTLTVNGNYYVSGSTVRWNGSSRPTSFVSGSELKATITMSDISFVGTANISVRNPSGETSNEMDFEIRNPAPAIIVLDPSWALIGGDGFILTVTGSGFVADSVVRWNGLDRSTTFISGTQLSMAVSNNDIAAVGTANVAVFNPEPGGELSNSVDFEIRNPAPAIIVLDPSWALIGGDGFILTVTGSGFVADSVVRWNGLDRSTTFISGTQLSMAVSNNDIAAVGTANVAVFNPEPGGELSNSVDFEIRNPAPAIIVLDPSWALIGGDGFILTVTGSGFVADSVVRWNGLDRSTTFISGTQLSMAVSNNDIAAVGTANVAVFNPEPGGELSNSVDFFIFKSVSINNDAACTNKKRVALVVQPPDTTYDEVCIKNIDSMCDPDKNRGWKQYKSPMGWRLKGPKEELKTVYVSFRKGRKGGSTLGPFTGSILFAKECQERTEYIGQ